MVKYSVELLPAADHDLENIFDYILLDNPKAAEQMLEKIITALKVSESFPNSGTRIIHNSLAHYHFRMVVVEPYIAFYKIADHVIYVYRILHSARDYIHLLDPY